MLRDRKLANIAATEPNLAATGNIGCITQLAPSCPVPVVHTIELLDWATGGPKPAAVIGMPVGFVGAAESKTALQAYTRLPSLIVEGRKGGSAMAAAAINALAKKLKTIQQHWARVADIVHLHCDLAQGQHQKRRGGASVGKAIALIDAKARSKGTSAAKLWDIWKRYKDAAHLITAAVLVSAEAQTRNRKEPFGIRLHQFQPYRMALLMPEFVISVALTIEKYGLEFVTHSSAEPLFDPQSLWRIPADINVAPISLPIRKITNSDVVVLNARRAGNRGQANRRKTTPVSA